MNLYDLIKYYIKHIYIIATVTIVTLTIGVIYTFFIQKPLYKSYTKIILTSQQANLATGNQTLINTYVNLITSRKVLTPVLEKEQGIESMEQLKNSIQATSQKNTAVIDVTVNSGDPVLSMQNANGVTDSFKKLVKEIYNDDSVVVVDAPVIATIPSNVNKSMQLIGSALLGFAISLIGLFFKYDYEIQRNKKLTTNQKKPLRKSTRKLSETTTKKSPAKRVRDEKA